MSKKLTYGSENVTSLYVGSQKVKKIYAGSELVYESTPLVLPVKGDTITINCGDIYGVMPFRVLSMNGTKALVSIVTSENRFNGKYDSSSEASVVYPRSSIDKGMVNCLQLYFSEQFQNACEFFDSTMYLMSTYSTSASSRYTWVKQDDTATYLAITTDPSRGSENFSRKIRIACFEDIISFLNASKGSSISTSTLNYNNITNMLFGTNSMANATYWLMNTGSKGIYYFNSSTGVITLGTSTALATSRRVIPVFNINLRKIPFTIVTPSNT